MTVAEQDLRPAWQQKAAIAADCDRTPTHDVRFRRVVLDQQGLHLVTDVHPNLTVVVVPPGQVERARRLVSTALLGAESGVHVELTDGEGRNLLLFRPHGGRSRVLDLDRQVEAVAPVFPAPATSVGDSRPPDGGGETWPWSMPAADVVVRLSAVDQGALWAAAGCLAARPGRIEAPEPADWGDERRGTLETAPRRHGAPRRRSGFGRRTTRAGGSDVGATQEAAGAAWRAVAGDVPLEAALSLRPAVEACATARSRTVALAAVSPGPPAAGTSPADRPDRPAEVEPVREVAETLAVVLAAPACTPQTLVLPPPGAGGAAVQLLLDVLPELLAGRQVVAVTSDGDVADWARLEELAGRATAAQARCR